MLNNTLQLIFFPLREPRQQLNDTCLPHPLVHMGSQGSSLLRGHAGR